MCMRYTAAKSTTSETLEMSGELEQIRAVVNCLPDPVFILTESGCYADIIGGADTKIGRAHV